MQARLEEELHKRALRQRFALLRAATAAGTVRRLLLTRALHNRRL